MAKLICQALEMHWVGQGREKGRDPVKRGQKYLDKMQPTMKLPVQFPVEPVRPLSRKVLVFYCTVG